MGITPLMLVLFIFCVAGLLGTTILVGLKRKGHVAMTGGFYVITFFAICYMIGSLPELKLLPQIGFVVMSAIVLYFCTVELRKEMARRKSDILV